MKKIQMSILADNSIFYKGAVMEVLKCIYNYRWLKTVLFTTWWPNRLLAFLPNNIGLRIRLFGVLTNEGNRRIWLIEGNAEFNFQPSVRICQCLQTSSRHNLPFISCFCMESQIWFSWPIAYLYGVASQSVQGPKVLICSPISYSYIKP